MALSFIEKKHDILDILTQVRADVRKVFTDSFSKGLVTEESWEACPTAVVSYGKDKIPMLKAAGFMNDPGDFEYGWRFKNSYYAKINSSLNAADRQLAEIINYLHDCNIRPKRYIFTGEEKAMFQVIEGKNKGSWAFQALMGGVNHG